MPEKGFLCTNKLFIYFKDESAENNNQMLRLLFDADHYAFVEGAYDVDRIVLSGAYRSGTAG